MTTDDSITEVLNNADISEADKQQLRRIIDSGLSAYEQKELARQMQDDPELLHQFNDVIKKKQEFLNDPDKFDEILEQEEALLNKLQEK
jgi:hypothetical protein